MAASVNKTVETDGDPWDFLASVDHPQRRADGLVLADMMQRLSGEPPRLWGPAIVGFGSYHYRYDSGREGDWCRIGFSPRKTNLSLHLMGCYGDGGFASRDALMARLGKFKTGASCLYVNRLADIDMAVLEQLCAESLAEMDRRYPR